MKILVHSIFYAPEPVGVAPYTAAMCEWLQQRGHQVQVVCPPPYYPHWRIQRPYRSWRYSRETVAGVRLTRCPIWVPRKPQSWRRVLYSLSFAVSSFPAILRKALWRPDVILVIEPSLVNAFVSLLAARCCGARSWLHIQDFEVDIALALGNVHDRRLRLLLFKFESWLLRRFDVVSTISDRMLQRLADKGVPPGRRVLFPNWVDTREIRPLPASSPSRQELGIRTGAIVALYSGSIGRKQDADLLVETARLLAERKNLLFVICGAGSEWARLRAAANGQRNLMFLPLQPRSRLNSLLNVADIHLLPQKSSMADLVMPSKLLGMLASGRPIVATANPGTQIADVVSRCGAVAPPGRASDFAETVLRLADHGRLRQHLGRVAREYAVIHCDAELVLERFEKRLALLARVSLPSRPAVTRSMVPLR